MENNDHLPRAGGGSGPVSPATTTGSTTTLVITGGELPSLPAGSLVGAELYTSAGTGSGQYLRITAHTTTGSVCTLTFNTATALGTDTIFEIHNIGGKGYTTSQYNNAIFSAIDAVANRTWTDLSNVSLAIERGDGNVTQQGLRRYEYPFPSGFMGFDRVKLLRKDPIEQHGIGYYNTLRAFGDDATRTRVSQGFQISQQSFIAYIAVYMAKVAAPTDNLTCVVETNSAGIPSGTVVTNGTSATVAGTTLQTRFRFVVFTFSPPMPLLEATTYHLTLRRSGAADATNYYCVGEDDGNNYANGALSTRNATVWAAVTGSDLLFAISEQSDFVNVARSLFSYQGQNVDQLFLRGESWQEGRIIQILGGAAIARPSTDATEVPLEPDYIMAAAMLYLKGARIGAVVADNPQAGSTAAAQRMMVAQVPWRPYPVNFQLVT